MKKRKDRPRVVFCVFGKEVNMTRSIVSVTVFLSIFIASGCLSADQSKTLYENRCGRCHDLSRVLDVRHKADFDGDWSKLVDRMKSKDNSGLRATEASTVSEYLKQTYR